MQGVGLSGVDTLHVEVHAACKLIVEYALALSLSQDPAHALTKTYRIQAHDY